MSEPILPAELADVLAVDAAALRSTGSTGFGIVDTGFVPKSFARLLAEKLATARLLLGDDVDLGSGSVLRKVLELAALEDARHWAVAAAVYDNSYAVSATGDGLTRLGEELGIPRPYQQARGTVTLKLAAPLPAGRNQLTLPRGARLSTPGGHHVALDETVVLTAATPQRSPAVAAFHPGPSHNLDPAQPNQRIDRWNRADTLLADLDDAEQAAGAELVLITHTAPLTGGELQVGDVRYRQLLLAAPRSVWTSEAIGLAVATVPGVRQVQVFDGRGGLDLNQSIFGNFNFIERVFSTERDLGNPYYFSVLVAPTAAAIWEGPDGLQAAVESVIEDLRPVGIFAAVERAEEVGIGVEADLVIRGLPLPTGSKETVNASTAATELRARLHARLRRYVDELPFGEPVRVAEVIWTLMNEPGVADVRDLRLVRFPADSATLVTGTAPTGDGVQRLAVGANAVLAANQVPVYVDRDDPRPFRIV
ncbi:baseplate J/gp47 family protein [Micromonospora siamensis]|uniref:Baseplate J-like protein n=1 Tax=Micromonospora siamensis TaxID=299152 RepID=A0A1C5J1Q7_9ACTN|nr:baseplate J/gp47 family protein [Micromonospora siamensis]SCG64455.1 Baseplate J-like protein [Micromonospora siamensis]